VVNPKATGGSELVVREILNHLDADLYALIDFESSNPESYLLSVKLVFLQNFPSPQRCSKVPAFVAVGD